MLWSWPPVPSPGVPQGPAPTNPDRLLPRLMGKPMKQHPEPLVRYA
ncbi:hypothetical protein ACFU8W_04325 [Streptomyces sp. NPDC057565]